MLAASLLLVFWPYVTLAQPASDSADFAAWITPSGQSCPKPTDAGKNCNKKNDGSYTCSLEGLPANIPKEMATPECKQSPNFKCIGNALTGKEECSPATPPPTTPPTPPKPQIVPNLQINIPEMPSLAEGVLATENGTAVLKFNWLSIYIKAVYRFAIGIAAMLAAVMMMIGGLQWMLARGDASWVAAGKEKISDAIIGLVLSLGVFVILQVVNPDILNLNDLTITSVPKIEMAADPEQSDNPIDVAQNFKSPVGDNIKGGGVYNVPQDLTPDIEAAAKALAAEGFGMYIGSSFRTPAKQEELIKLNCQNPPGSADCKPFDGKPYTCPMAGKPPNPKNCAHTTGHALDVFGMRRDTKGNYARCIPDWKTCINNTATCVADECQKALIKALGDVGFCRWSGEAWHFEKPGMSKNCNIGQ